MKKIGMIYGSDEKVKDGTVVGRTSTEGYDFDESLGVIDGEFIGLCIDEDMQDELTNERLKNWYEDIKKYFNQSFLLNM